MATNILATLLNDYRLKNQISQEKLAEELGITQANVSRIETGEQQPSEKIAKKIRSLLANDASLQETQEPKGKNRVDKGSLKLKEKITVSYVSLAPTAASGDVCVVEKLSPSTGIFLLADTVGHGKEASHMAFALRFGFQILSSTYQPHMLRPNISEQALAGALQKTKQYWLGPPSVTLGAIHAANGDVELVNDGNPPVFSFRSKENSVKVVDHKPIRPSLSLTTDLMTQTTDTIVINLEFGDSLLIYSDGLTDSIPKSTVKESFASYAKLFKGDADSIVANLISDVQNKQVELADDTTFLVICRERE